MPWVITTPSVSGDLSDVVEPLGELQPDLVVHVLAADVDDLLAGDDRQLVEVRDRLDQLLDVERAGLVAIVAGAGLRPGDRAASGEHGHARARPAGPGRSCRALASSDRGRRS